MPFTVITQPQPLTAVPGQNSTFTVQASSNDITPLSAAYTYQWFTVTGGVSSLITDATSPTYVFDPLIGDSGRRFFAVSNFLSGAPATTFVRQITSSAATLTVNEDVPPFDVYDQGPETGRERHLRLRLLGYI